MDQETLDMIGLGGSSTPSSGTAWESWIQKAGSSLLGAYSQNQQFNQNYELQKLRIQSQNQYGQMYVDGQPVNGMGMSSNTLLLLGVVVVAVMMLKD